MELEKTKVATRGTWNQRKRPPPHSALDFTLFFTSRDILVRALRTACALWPLSIIENGWELRGAEQGCALVAVLTSAPNKEREK